MGKSPKLQLENTVEFLRPGVFLLSLGKKILGAVSQVQTTLKNSKAKYNPAKENDQRQISC